jgi:hypothetical protein
MHKIEAMILSSYNIQKLLLFNSIRLFALEYSYSLNLSIFVSMINFILIEVIRIWFFHQNLFYLYLKYFITKSHSDSKSQMKHLANHSLLIIIII